jgi:CheY-like chemotaxis protein
MPHVSGLELIAQIGRQYGRRGERIPPSCAVSAHAREVDRRAAIEAGFDMYLAKPTTPESLIEAVADLGDLRLRAR